MRDDQPLKLDGNAMLEEKAFFILLMMVPVFYYHTNRLHLLDRLVSSLNVHLGTSLIHYFVLR